MTVLSARRSTRQEPQSTDIFQFSLSSLNMILLAFFVFLVANSQVDKLKASKALESLDANFPGRIRASADVIEEASRTAVIEKIAREAGFGVVSELDRLVVTLPEAKAFESGSDILHQSAVAPLRKIAEVVKNLELLATIEGHTDDSPISTVRFPSNWELSAARAVSVLKIFLQQGISAEKLSAAGRGEFLPIATNETLEGRALNRRVVLVIEPGGKP